LLCFVVRVSVGFAVCDRDPVDVLDFLVDAESVKLCVEVRLCLAVFESV